MVGTGKLLALIFFVVLHWQSASDSNALSISSASLNVCSRADAERFTPASASTSNKSEGKPVAPLEEGVEN